MKKSLVVLVALFSLVFAISGCSKEKPVNSEKVTSAMQEKIKKAGARAIIVNNDGSLVLILTSPDTDNISVLRQIGAERQFNLTAYSLAREALVVVSAGTSPGEQSRHDILSGMFLRGEKVSVNPVPAWLEKDTTGNFF